MSATITYNGIRMDIIGMSEIFENQDNCKHDEVEEIDLSVLEQELEKHNYTDYSMETE